MTEQAYLICTRVDDMTSPPTPSSTATCCCPCRCTALVWVSAVQLPGTPDDAVPLCWPCVSHVTLDPDLAMRQAIGAHFQAIFGGLS